MAEFKEIDDINFPYEAGLIKDRAQALTFADYLNSKGIKAVAKPGFGSSYAIYVRDESDVSKVKIELLHFMNSPFAKEYNKAAWASGRTVKRERTQGQGTLGFMMGNYAWNPFTLTSVIEIICIAIYLVMLLSNLEPYLLGTLSWTSLAQITEGGEVWRVIIPIFLHFGILHIAFNLVMFEAFARNIERFLGTFKLLGLVLAMAVFSNAVQLLFQDGMHVYGGMSGVVYGVIGYMGILSRREDIPEGLRIPNGLLLVSVIFIGFGFFLSGMANFAHVGGLVVGMLAGLIDLKGKLRLKEA